MIITCWKRRRIYFEKAIAGGDLSNNKAVENRLDTCSVQQLTKRVCHATATALPLGGEGIKP